MLFLKYLSVKIEPEKAISPVNKFLEILFGGEKRRHVFTIGINNYSCCLIPVFRNTLYGEKNCVTGFEHDFSNTNVIVLNKYSSIFQKILYFFQNILHSLKTIKRNYSLIDVFVNIDNNWELLTLDLQSNRLNLHKNIIESTKNKKLLVKKWLNKNFTKIIKNLTILTKNETQISMKNKRVVNNRTLNKWTSCKNIYDLLNHIFQQPLDSIPSSRAFKLKQGIQFKRNFIIFLIEDYKSFKIKTPTLKENSTSVEL